MPPDLTAPTLHPPEAPTAFGLLVPQESVPEFLGVSRPTFFRNKASRSDFPKPVALAHAPVSYKRRELEEFVAKLKSDRGPRRKPPAKGNGQS